MIGKKVVTIFVIISFLTSSFAPIFVGRAEANTGTNVMIGAAAAIGAAMLLPHVPSGDTVQTLIMGFLNAAAIAIAQAMVNEIINSTITWANDGFEGNPAYVTNLGGFMGGIANREFGGFLNEVTNSNLCTPFKNTVVVSLQKYYASNSGSSSFNSQCSFTDIGRNLENFYQDFSEGGWDSWFQVTQNSQNPYDNIINARTNLDNRLANALGVQQTKLNWGQGFKAKGDCKRKNEVPPQYDLDAYNNGEESWEVMSAKYPNWSPDDDEGACLEHGPDKTPGSVIKTQLDKVLSGPFEGLVSVKKFDELIGALAAGLLQKFVFGPQGLFNKDPGKRTGLPSAGDVDTGSSDAVQCTANVTKAYMNETIVTWNVISTSGLRTDYTWIGEGLTNATSSSPKVIYQTDGQKNASVIASSTTIMGTNKTVKVDCKTTVVVSKYSPLSATCTAIPAGGSRTRVTGTCGSGNNLCEFEKPYWDNLFLYTPSNVTKWKAGTLSSALNELFQKHFILWTVKITGGSGELKFFSVWNESSDKRGLRLPYYIVGESGSASLIATGSRKNNLLMTDTPNGKEFVLEIPAYYHRDGANGGTGAIGIKAIDNDDTVGPVINITCPPVEIL